MRDYAGLCAEIYKVNKKTCDFTTGKYCCVHKNAIEFDNSYF